MTEPKSLWSDTTAPRPVKRARASHGTIRPQVQKGLLELIVEDEGKWRLGADPRLFGSRAQGPLLVDDRAVAIPQGSELHQDLGDTECRKRGDRTWD